MKQNSRKICCQTSVVDSLTQTGDGLLPGWRLDRIYKNRFLLNASLTVTYLHSTTTMLNL